MQGASNIQKIQYLGKNSQLLVYVLDPGFLLMHYMSDTRFTTTFSGDCVCVCVCVCEPASTGSGLSSVVGCCKRNIDPSSGEKGKEFLDSLGTALASEDRFFAVNQYCVSTCT